MVKRWLVSCVVAVAVAGVPGVAHAQRDPFDPLVTVGEQSAPRAGATSDAPPVIVRGRPAPEPLAQTGAEVEVWAAIAYGLVAMGAGLVVAGRLNATNR